MRQAGVGREGVQRAEGAPRAQLSALCAPPLPPSLLQVVNGSSNIFVYTASDQARGGPPLSLPPVSIASLAHRRHVTNR